MLWFLACVHRWFAVLHVQELKYSSKMVAAWFRDHAVLRVVLVVLQEIAHNSWPLNGPNAHGQMLFQLLQDVDHVVVAAADGHVVDVVQDGHVPRF